MPYYYTVREKVLRYIREREMLRAGDRVAVAVSGGADSLALLRVLIELRNELGIVLSVAHFNHGLRGMESDADQAFVAELARQFALEFFAGVADVRDHALVNKLSLEAAGRELRYGWFARLARAHRLDVVATAHTLDDQAETVLLKLLRGTGTKGLAGIWPVVLGGDGGALRIVRPLLGVSRNAVECYLESLGQPWREDTTNLDRRFLRNRVRHELLPLLEREYNPGIREALSDLAELARAEEEYWREQVDRELARHASTAGLNVGNFAQLPLALQRRWLKRFAEGEQLGLDFRHIEELRRCALGERTRTELPGGKIATRVREKLTICRPTAESASGYEYVLAIPGEVHVGALGVGLRAHVVAEKFARELPRDELLCAGLLGPELVIRSWRPGDRFRPAHSRAEEKLKRLFAEKRVPAGERASWPVAVHNQQIVWVRGFPVAQDFHWRGAGDAVRIEIVGS